MSSDVRFGIRQFTYPSIASNDLTGIQIAENTARIAELEQTAHDAGVQEGEQRARQRYENNLAHEREALANCIREFLAEGQRYRERVEAEVVQLALAIARKILRREAQLDPLLLAGAVRVALDRLHKATSLQLRVAPAVVESWKSYFATHTEVAAMPEVLADSSLAVGECRLHSDLGNVELGVEAQLREMENRLGELFGRNPEP